MAYYQRVYGLDLMIRELRIPDHHPFAGATIAEVESHSGVLVIASFGNSELRMGPWRGLTLAAGDRIAILGQPQNLEVFAQESNLELLQLDIFSDALAPEKSGVAELVIPPRSNLLGKTVRDIAMRKTFGLSVLGIHRAGEMHQQDIRELPLAAGDVLVSHCRWDNLVTLEQNRDFVVMTADYPKEVLRPQKVKPAAFFFVLALALIIFTDLRLSVALLTGAMGMILTNVLSMDEAYRAVSWKTVFLLASLIPLGAAVQDTGTAAWIAQSTLQMLGDVSPLMLQAVIAILATFFTLVMSNVGATVLLVPLAINIALAAQGMGMDADPRIFALTAAIATSNSFLIPTHQVNALIMGPGGYRVKDFMKAGGIMSVLFLIVALAMLNWLY
jgi:di/tricarboxylate transporter